MLKHIRFLPAALFAAGLLLVIIAIYVTGLRYENIELKEHEVLQSIRERTANKDSIWSNVYAYAKTNTFYAKPLMAARQSYFERKISLSVAGIITMIALLSLWVCCIVVINNNYLSGSAVKRKWLIGSCIVIPLLFMILLMFNNIATNKGPVDNISSVMRSYGDIGTVVMFGQIAGSLAGAGIISLVVASCALLNIEANRLKEQIAEAKLLLGISSLALASGVVSNYLWFTWPAPVMEDAKQVVQLANTLTVNVATIFTFILVILFTPVAIMHQYELSKKKKDGESAVEWTLVVREFLTCIIPILVAVIAQWLGYKG